MLNRNEEDMLALLRSALWGAEAPVMADADGVGREMRDHAVTFLPDRMCGDADERENARVRNIAFNMRLSYVQQTCLDALEAAGIGAVVLKGSAAAVYYPQPERRTFGDIDLLVRDAQFERAADILAACGEAGNAADGETGRHGHFGVDGVTVELHRYFADDAALDARLKAAIPRARTAELFGMRFRMLPPIENGLAILDHIRRHLVGGQIGLRQVVDWMMFVHGELRDAADFEAFCKEAGKYRLDTFAAAMTKMCQIYLGLPGEYGVCTDERLCEELLDCFTVSGNFGRKRKNARSRTIGALTAMQGGVFRHLWREGAKNDADEGRRTKLFRCSRQVLRYVRLGIQNGQGLATLRQDLRESRGKARLFRQLGLGEE